MTTALEKGVPMTRYALVHEWLTPYATGGSELVVREMLQDIEADLFALIDFESSNPDSYLYGRAIATSFFTKISPGQVRFAKLSAADAPGH